QCPRLCRAHLRHPGDHVALRGRAGARQPGPPPKPSVRARLWCKRHAMTATSDLVSSVAHLAQAKVLCVGDLMLDRFVYGQVERVSPEAPIPVVSVERELAMLGGAGNVVRNLVALGAETCFISVIGDD